MERVTRTSYLLRPTRLDVSILATPRTDFGRFSPSQIGIWGLILLILCFRGIEGSGIMLRGHFAHTIQTDSPI